MGNKIQPQAAKLWGILSAPGTLETYQQAVVTTWEIIKEAAILVWQLCCFVLVISDWITANTIAAAHRLRSGLVSLKETDTQQVASEAGKAFLSTGKASIIALISQARSHLGLPERTALQQVSLNRPASDLPEIAALPVAEKQAEAGDRPPEPPTAES